MIDTAIATVYVTGREGKVFSLEILQNGHVRHGRKLTEEERTLADKVSMAIFEFNYSDQPHRSKERP